MRHIAPLLVMLVIVLPARPLSVAAAPKLTISAPANQATLAGKDVEVVFEAGDFTIVPSTVTLADYGMRPDANRPGEGHVHLALDLEPLVVWDQNAPYTFRNVPPGEHQLTVELANNDHSSLVPPVVRTVGFTTVAAQATPAAPPAPARMPGTGASDYGPWLAGAALLAIALGLAASHRSRRV